MSYKVFRVHRGRVLHIVHETLTGDNRTHDVHILCNLGACDGVHERGVPTCPVCLDMDNPVGLSASERVMMARFATQDPPPPPAGQSWGGDAITSRHKKDLINKHEKLTRRGAILALDWTEGPSPAADRLGIVHARDPLSERPICGRGLILDGFAQMTVDKYARMRALGQHVTCVLCVSRYLR